MSRKLKIGDAVKLVGGSGRMTLLSIDDHGVATCAKKLPWEWGDIIKTERFPLLALRRCFFQ